MKSTLGTPQVMKALCTFLVLSVGANGYAINGTAIKRGISGPLPIDFPNLPQQTGCRAYIVGSIPSGNDVFLDQNSQYAAVVAGPQSEPVEIFGHAQGSGMSLPASPLFSGRIYVACGGTDLHFNKVRDGEGHSKISAAATPDDHYNYMEFTMTAEGLIYINISFVDMMANPPLGYALEGGPTRKIVRGAKHGATDAVCADLETQSQKDGMPWNQLCQRASDGYVRRVLSPVEHMKTNPDAFDGYFTEHAKQVYRSWYNSPRSFDIGQTKVTCIGAADGSSASCNGQFYGIPTAGDVFGCASGPFAAVADPVFSGLRPPFCAAFNRGTAATLYHHENTPKNWYNTFVHKHTENHIGYAFPFDEVPVGSKSFDGTISSGDTTCLTINVGGTWPEGS